MAAEKRLREDLAALEQTNNRMREVFETRQGDWKLALVRLRKEQAGQLAALSKSLTTWANEDPGGTDRHETIELLATLRRSISVTQSEWPLSLINDDTALAAYMRASKRTIAASETFFTAINARLTR